MKKKKKDNPCQWLLIKRNYFLTDLKAGGPSSIFYQLPYLLRATSWLMSPPKVTFHQIIYPVHWGTTVMMSVHPKGPISSSLDYKIAACEFGPHRFSTEQRPIVLDTRKAACLFCMVTLSISQQVVSNKTFCDFLDREQRWDDSNHRDVKGAAANTTPELQWEKKRSYVQHNPSLLKLPWLLSHINPGKQEGALGWF